MNSITVIGNAVADGQVRTTKTGTQVGDIRIAVNKRYFDKVSNTWKDGQTLYATVIGWSNKATSVGSIKKGEKVFAMGELSTKEFDKKDNTKGFAVEITAEQVFKVDGGYANAAGKPASVGTKVPTPFEEQDLPF